MMIDGLVALVAALGDYFTLHGVAAKVDFGLKARSSNLNQGPGGASRVVIIPGKIDPTSDKPPKVVDAGTLGQPRHNTTNPRALAWWRKAISVSIWGVDASSKAALQSELAQYAATVDLLEKTYQGLHNAKWTDPTDSTKTQPVGLADLVLESAVWVSPPTEQAFGRELLLFFEYSGPLYDRVVGTATPSPAIVRNPPA